jgi:flagellar biosynthesis/type III secretory pathway chaperone
MTRPVNPLTELVERKCACLAELHELSRRQLELIDGEQMSGLIDLLAGKQRLIGLLQAIDQQLGPHRGLPPAARAWSSESERTRCGALLARCEALLADILRQEKLGEERLIERRNQTALRVATTWQAHEARGAYAAAGRHAGSRLDLISEG